MIPPMRPVETSFRYGPGNGSYKGAESTITLVAYAVLSLSGRSADNRSGYMIVAHIVAAGFATSKTSALSSAETAVARVQPAPQMATKSGYDCLLSRISIGISENAARLHRLDLEGLGRRAEVKSQLQKTLTDLRNKVARKAAARLRPACVDGIVELCHKAG